MSDLHLLSKFKNKFNIGKVEPGDWRIKTSKGFKDIANSLSVVDESCSVSSIPSIWARPLAMEMALYDDSHPLHNEMVKQWRGMLAAIALTKLRHFDLQVKLLELENLKSFDLALSLLKLLPSPENCLYKLSNGKNPWQHIYIFLLKDQPVGMTSPSTLVCTSEEGNWEKLQWWSQGQWHSPISYLNEDEKVQLWLWIKNLIEELNKHEGNRSAINQIVSLLGNFQQDLLQSPPSHQALRKASDYFTPPINIEALAGLNFPIEIPPLTPKKPDSPKSDVSFPKSCVRLEHSDGIDTTDELIIIPDVEQIKIQWRKEPQNIYLYHYQTLAAYSLETLRQDHPNVRFLEAKEILLSELFFIKQENALPGALLPQGSDQLNKGQDEQGNTRRITPLLPINPILLEYLTPEDLNNKISLELIDTGTESDIKFTIRLPLSGGMYLIEEQYKLKDANALAEIPVLEIWPNFRADKWQEYYGFYYDVAQGNNTFQVSLPNEKENYTLDLGLAGLNKTFRLEKFPSYIRCQNSADELQGLILLKTPEQRGVYDITEWIVGVDFGTSFTNIYYKKRNGAREPLSLENLSLQVTKSNLQKRLTALVNYFIPDQIFSRPLPLSTVLTTRGSRQISFEKNRLIFEGRIFVPANSEEFNPQDDWIHTGLKWSKTDRYLNLLFLKNVALLVTAQAVKNNVKAIQWSFAFPSAFSTENQTFYHKEWQSIIDELKQKTGIEHFYPTINNTEFWRTETVAFGQFFAEQRIEGLDLFHTTCIDIGGGTSDIAIWEGGKIIHQCSVLFAGRHLFSQFLQLDSELSEYITKNFENPENDVIDSNWSNLTPQRRDAKADFLLRIGSKRFLSDIRKFGDDPEFKKLKLLMAIGMSGLYYYIGTVLKRLNEEGRLASSEITHIYVGGNGSNFLHWLDINGHFITSSKCEPNLLLRRMLCKGAGFEEANDAGNTFLSEKCKDEVAFGLTGGDVSIDTSEENTLSGFIAGENCELNGKTIQYDERLPVEGKIENFKVLELAQLSNFLYEFHDALKTIEIDKNKGIKNIIHLEGYEHTKDLSSNQELWKKIIRQLNASLARQQGEIKDIGPLQPPFILALKELLRVVGNPLWNQ